MRNDTRNRIHVGITAVPVRIAVLAGFSINAAVTPILAWADVPTPPPAYHKQIDTSFPSGKALLNQGYNPNTGVLRVEGQKTGKPTVTSNGQTVTGTQNARVVVTDHYGNKGTMTTKITQTVGTGSVVVVASNTIGNSIKKASEEFGSELSNNLNNGDYYGAFVNSARIVGGAIDNTFTGGFLGDAFGAYGSDNARRTADRLINSLYGGGPGTGTPSTGNPSSPSTGNPSSPSTGNPSSPSTGNPSSPSTGNPSSPSTGNPSSPSTGSPTSPGNPSNPSSGGGGSSSGLGSAANAAGSAQRTSERNGDVSGAIGNAAFKKTADFIGNASSELSGYEERSKNNQSGYKLYKVEASGIYRDSSGVYRQDRKVKVMSLPGPVSFSWVYVGSKQASYLENQGYPILKREGLFNKRFDIRSNLISNDLDYRDAVNSSFSFDDMVLTSEEIKQILQRMFNSQQTNHQEMMRQLSQIAANTAPNTSTSTSTETTPPSTTGSQVIRGGDSVVDQATTSRTVSTSEAISAPFTPAGSNVAGRTKFTLHSDGSVTTTFVPDTSLKPHSSQAPTRTSAAPAASQTADATTPNTPGQTTPTTPSPTAPDSPNSQQNQQQRDFCQYNPMAAQCVDLGNSDYEDLDVPESEIDLELEPLDVFSTDGTCPENVFFEFGALGSFEFDYGHICGVLRLIRPILIIGTIITCGFVAYGAIKEL